MKNLFRLSVLSFALLTAGCGYTTKSTLPPHLKTVHIEPFENTIDYTQEGRRTLYIPLLEVDIQKALIDRFLFDGNLRISTTERADLILSGKLLNYERQVLRYTDNDDVEEYRIYITVALEMFDTHKQEVMWTESGFVGETTFFITGPLAQSEDSAVNEAIEDLSRRIVERTIEDW